MKLPETFPGGDISVVIPTWRRPANLRRTLARFFACNPAPREIIIHIDAGDAETAPMLDREFAGKATWFQSTSTRGPGGGRNLLLQRAQCPLVASFDDDSYPIDEDYFARVK